MILLSELSRRRIRSIQKLIRVGRNEVVVVLRVDKEKGAFCEGCFGLSLISENSQQATSICQSAASHQKISLNVRSAI